MTQNNHCTIFISINKDNKIKYIIKNDDNIIQEETEYLPISISFDMNEIIIHEQRNDSINFINDFVNNPEEFKEYPISYQGKEYEVIAEVLLSLILHQYKNQIEKKYIIDETILNIETEEENKILINRIKVSIDAIGLRISEIEIPEYDYQKQGEILHGIIDKYNEFNKFKNILIKSQNINLLDNSQPINEERIEQITRMNKICQIDNYCLFLASKYFETIEDHINLVRVCKRMRLNMEKFHFNPFPLTHTTREFFPRLQTLFVYNKEDELFENDHRIIARKKQITPYYLKGKETMQIEEWTGLYCGEILFDSEIDNWKKNESVFDERIKGRKQLLFIIEDEYHEQFGYYLNTKVNNKYTPQKYPNFQEKPKSQKN